MNCHLIDNLDFLLQSKNMKPEKIELNSTNMFHMVKPQSSGVKGQLDKITSIYLYYIIYTI